MPMASQVNADKEKVRRLWDNYYVPYVSGYFDAWASSAPTT